MKNRKLTERQRTKLVTGKVFRRQYSTSWIKNKNKKVLRLLYWTKTQTCYNITYMQDFFFAFLSPPTFRTLFIPKSHFNKWTNVFCVCFFFKNPGNPLEELILISSKKCPGNWDTRVLVQALPLFLLCVFEQVTFFLDFFFKSAYNNGFHLENAIALMSAVL